MLGLIAGAQVAINIPVAVKLNDERETSSASTAGTGTGQVAVSDFTTERPGYAIFYNSLYITVGASYLEMYGCKCTPTIRAPFHLFRLYGDRCHLRTRTHTL